MKLGKKPATKDARDLKFARYLTAALPTPPKTFGHQDLIKSWGMLGNDQYGDCVLAAAAHETMLWNAAAGKSVAFDDKAVLSDYSAITGFRADQPGTDNGTNVRDALKYRKKIGVVDANGVRHKIGAFVALQPGNLPHFRAALYLFGVVEIGIQFPSTAMDQFNAGKPWDVVRRATIEGGHDIPIVAAAPKKFVCVTWAALQSMTERFYVKYCDEAYAILSPEMLVNGKTLEGFDLAALQADLKAVV